jgi:phage baseplate assembly protein W
MLLRWEPRIVVTSSKVEQRDGELVVRLAYAYVHEPVSEQLILPLP